jgi:hypothetical protein
MCEKYLSLINAQFFQRLALRFTDYHSETENVCTQEVGISVIIGASAAMAIYAL